MHVKEQVKEFVHDVKRKFSKKRRRETSSTFDSYDGASTYLDDSSSTSSISSLGSTSERRRFIKFLRPRTPSIISRKHSLHKGKKSDGKRHRLVSAPTVPSEPMVESHPKQPTSYQGPPVSTTLDTADEPSTSGTSKAPYSEVIDIRALDSAAMNSAVAVAATESTQTLSGAADRDSLSQTQPPFDTESHSDASGTLVTSADFSQSTLDSDSRFDSVDLHSDKTSDKAHDSVPRISITPPSDPMADVPPPPPPKTDEEEITLAQSPHVAPSPHHPPPATTTPASPAPVYLPRLTAPSMFLPIPNTDPLSALLTKYVPAEQRPRRDVVGEYAGRDVPEMVMSNSWRALARMARDRIVASDPEDLVRILDLWSLRLSSLARLRLTNQASAECTNLFAVLNAVPPSSVPGAFPGTGTLAPSTPLSVSPAVGSLPLSPSGLGGLVQLPGTPSQKPSTLPGGSVPAITPRQGTHGLLHPFELTVFHARVHYWSGDPLGYVDALHRILGKCKEKAREEGRIVALRRELGRASGVQEGGADDTSQTGRGRGQEEDVIQGGDKEVVEENTENAEVEDEKVDDDSDETESQDEDDTEEAQDKEAQDEGEEDTGECTENTGAHDEKKEEQDDVLVTAEANLSMWLERIARICLILASQMIEMNDYQAAINLLAPLCSHRATPTSMPTPSPELHSALARVYLLSGNLEKARKHFSLAASAAENSANGANIVIMNTALLAVTSGDWVRAEEALQEMVTRDPGNFTAINNLAVTLLCQGRIKKGIDLLEVALRMSPSSVVVAEPFLFNLSTLYELRSTAAIDQKRGLLLEVAKWSGDGLRTSCLKMPSN